jgi:hypothetical protein
MNVGLTTEQAKTNLQATTKKQSHHDKYATHHAHNDCWTSRESSHLAEPVTPSLVPKEQVQATTTKTTILLVIQK